MQLKTNNPAESKEKLSVLIHQDGLSFYSYNDARILNSFHQDVKLGANPVELLQLLQDIYEKEAFLSSVFAKASLIYHHDIFTTVPAAFYEEEYAVDYLKYNARLLETDILSVDKNPTVGAHTVYMAYTAINDYFFDKYGSYEYYHYSSRILEYRSKLPATLQPFVYLDLKKSHFYLTIFKGGKLIAQNLFQHDAIEDILYYTMFTAYHNGLDPESMHLILCVEEQHSALFDLLYTYVRHVSYEHRYKDYQKQILCV
jgi:hypothetical protein